MKGVSAAAIFRSSWMIIAMAVILLLFLSVNWFYFMKIRTGLDREFSIRLESLASLVSSSVDPGRFSDLPGENDGNGGDDPLGDPLPGLPREMPGGGDSDTLLALLEGYARDFELSNISILREDGVILMSIHPEFYRPGEIYPLWNMDYPAIIKALDGSPASTALVRGQDEGYFKAGYAPVPPGSAGAQAVAAVEADAGFLEGLSNLRAILLYATALSAAGLLLFVWLFLKATSSLLRARETLLQSEGLAAMGRMAAGIAHEIRNPLFIIRSSAGKLKDLHPESAGEIDEFIIEETDRLNGILTDYLLFARNEPGKRRTADLSAIIKRCAKLLGEGAPDGATPVAIDDGGAEAPLLCEEKKLQQVFLNVLLNARQAGGSGEVAVKIERKHDRYKVSVSDRGKGVGARELARVFEPFYTTKTAGSGLGLAVARKIVEDHGGEISMESVEGEGTTVIITLPFRAGKAGESDEPDNNSR